ncbi:hypothetical protein [Dinghuibacter silviterrae]|uniref:Uncharacterized protein n=1 Tax=Dinghuibacter silviterrae TaxID=1539049 RepID=A0A4R8DQQ5_9BACT|nr:hypothetical protein [Dinghuibacter silviterrae]TDX00482.1 hypothetical protein EDB95_1507 [Dinghuibacter silviterrae]
MRMSNERKLKTLRVIWGAVEDETGLIERFKEGNMEARQRIFERFYAMLCFFLSLLIDEDDVIKEEVWKIYIELFKKAAEFENLDEIEDCLFESGRKFCRNYFGKMGSITGQALEDKINGAIILAKLIKLRYCWQRGIITRERRKRDEGDRLFALAFSP